MSLEFLGMDEASNRCPHCGSRSLLVYTSFSKRPISCDVCVLLRKAEPKPEPTWVDVETAIKEIEDRGFKMLPPVRLEYSKEFEEYWAGEKKRKQVV